MQECVKRINGLKTKEEEVKTVLDTQRHQADETKTQQAGQISERDALKTGELTAKEALSVLMLYGSSALLGRPCCGLSI